MTHNRSLSPSVDFLYSDDCPAHEQALELLQDTLKEQGVHADIHVQRVETQREAEALRFPGSPTIRIAGQDIDPTPEASVGLACRAYLHDNGHISPVPPKNKIIEALLLAASKTYFKS